MEEHSKLIENKLMDLIPLLEMDGEKHVSIVIHALLGCMASGQTDLLAANVAKFTKEVLLRNLNESKARRN